MIGIGFFERWIIFGVVEEKLRYSFFFFGYVVFFFFLGKFYGYVNYIMDNICKLVMVWFVFLFVELLNLFLVFILKLEESFEWKIWDV